ncbi:type III-B CRISPR module RAMP protein Cmr1 [Paenibacillus aquistagni]|uniref:CRISPR-associated protein, Cmr1 family n=1 Tax=Paenibacillus aquistagni TaxID=1852522 RepID=A0A1X7LPK2_9BACL|nr:type III-B CRISPR module RAMP protein Cmr1 [Paenibacillus aquistagni]SMG55437.1 CRISPR-associated protein, Cmr1 family [Paenibacillus aquistagni]
MIDQDGKRQELKQLHDIVDKVSQHRSTLQERYFIKVVTPMFGGSSEPGDVDPRFPIRSASIRGHLRFWWRATRGARYETAEELRKVESNIFGDTQHPSKVKIWVDQPIHKPQKIEFKKRGEAGYNEELSNLRYVLFPFENKLSSLKKCTNKQWNSQQGQKENDDMYYPSHSFELYIEYLLGVGKSEEDQQLELEKYKKEIHAALWAWINFGGIGARTRRGCGSLYCSRFSMKEDERFYNQRDVEKWYKEHLQTYGIQLLSGNKSREWPTLSNEIHLQFHKQEIWDAWSKTIRVYQLFRSRRPSTKETGTKRPGRSYWPEADSIRKLTNMHSNKHKELLTISRSDDQEYAFPRAVFGLPIITKFTGENGAGNREPYTTQLTPGGKEKARLASPLITKAIAVSEHDGHGALIVLKQPKIEGLELSLAGDEAKNKHNQTHTSLIEAKLRSTVINKHHIYEPSVTYKNPVNNPMAKPEGMYYSALEAFLNIKEVKDWKR